MGPHHVVCLRAPTILDPPLADTDVISTHTVYHSPTPTCMYPIPVLCLMVSNDPAIAYNSSWYTRTLSPLLGTVNCEIVVHWEDRRV